MIISQADSVNGGNDTMRENFDKQLSELNEKLLQMAGMAEQIIAMSFKSLQEQDEKLARQAIEFDSGINEIEREIERICLKLMLKYQPVFADDLRKVSSALKMITDMERIGDQAADIAGLNVSLIGKNQSWDLSEITEMARAAAEMVSGATQAYINSNVEDAEKIIKADDRIDELFDKVKARIIDDIAEDKSKGEKALDTLMVAKYYERIGDHAVNIAEWVVFSITGIHKDERIM